MTVTVKTNMIYKYRTETCCVICNYYSLRSQHEMEVVYFQRALKLNPGYFKKFIFELKGNLQIF